MNLFTERRLAFPVPARPVPFRLQLSYSLELGRATRKLT